MEKEEAAKAAPETFNKDSEFREHEQHEQGTFSELKDDISYNQTGDKPNEKTIGLFRLRDGNRRMADGHLMPIPIGIFHNVLYRGEVTILYADTGSGKSILAIQIALEVCESGEIVLVIDLELSDKQFEARYSDNYEKPFEFPDNFHIADMTIYPKIPEDYTYEDWFIECMRMLIIETKATFVVIDNMTKLVSADTDKAQVAKPLMDRLIDLKREFNLTMLLLEHTRKTDMYRQISLNDLQGSKMKANFTDSVFAIGRSAKDVNLRYIKQLKCRSTEITFDEDNVMVCEVVKENSFLYFKPIGYSSESEHLKKPDDKDRSSLIDKVKELSEGGKSQREIANELGISLGAVNKYLKR
ncbi:AAA family ATPase [Dysgonomonas sp. Marseille-P4677]|uniref:AAA family ATPase n=1 Tax=Dysgonomonas sp. Marseille-P4677 TaxID=2364790 RepID=UPI0019115CB8|nr:AAA family ATPase [Dysgonomonas sp. Marseille-P4677]MBK5722631.1 AAA family ATPase [Dysgonomonas sp. Marseille-P4677]